MMAALVCWLLGHRWRECRYAAETDRMLRTLPGYERCRGLCVRCRKHKGYITCLICEGT